MHTQQRLAVKIWKEGSFELPLELITHSG
eukprot:COSAG04_NODE_10647_length_761_cov_1.392749_2_plen_28_part_01